jgi:uncharacterized iron-regulated membrane protein
MKSRLRKAFKGLHIFVGLGFGLFFCMMGLTGSAIVFRYQIEDALRPHWRAMAPVPAIPAVDAALANAARRWPDAEISRVSFPERPGDPYRLLLRAEKGTVHAYCDGRTGEVLGTFDVAWLDGAVDLHHSLLKLPSGKQIVGVFGIALFLVSLSGIVIWLMRRPSWNDIGRVGWGGPWKRVNFELHRSTGILMNALLLFVSFTGMWMAYPNTFRSAVETLFGAPTKTPKIKVRESELGRPVSAYAETAAQSIPGGVVRELRLQSPVSATVWLPTDLRPGGNNQVTLDPASGKVLAVEEASKWPISKVIVQSAKPLHYAEWGGLPLRILWFLIGLSPTVLLVSGVLIVRNKAFAPKPKPRVLQSEDLPTGLAEVDAADSLR